MPNFDLLTAAQVAERKGVTVRTVARWVESGKLPVAHRLPGKTGALLFDPADVDALKMVTTTRLDTGEAVA